MLHWRDIHPYNAVHVVIVAETLDGARLGEAITRELQARGLAHLELDRARGCYEWHGGRQEADLKLLPDDDPPALVHDEIARQLNAAFPADGRISPFRFFAVDAGSSFYLGLGYDHFVAGGDSIVGLLSGIVGRYRGESVAQDTAGRASAPSYAGMFVRQVGALVRVLTGLPGFAAGCRRSLRPAYSAIDDGHNAFVRLRLGPPELAAFIRAAQTWGVTQNDLFMTILLKVLSPLAAKRRQQSRRCELAIASIVNIRRDFGSQAQHAFVPLLASFRVSHRVPDEISMNELAQFVHEESERIKRGKLYLQTLLALGLAALEWRFLSETRRRRFFAKHCPVWAGTTALNVTRLWSRGSGRGPTPEYLRAVSTGPLAPMVCAISTADEVVNVGITYRTAAFDRRTVDGVVAEMLSRIKSL
jgi:hypothetical protein